MSNKSRQGIEKIIGQIWFVKNNFESFSKHPLVVRRAGLVQDIIEVFADYNPKKVSFANRLVLGNFLGSLQNYLTGFDLNSIHLSSKTLELALLIKIGKLNESEKCSSFGQLCKIAISESRGLIKQKENIKRVRNIVDRRNFTTHDAISEQALLWVSREWVQQKLSEFKPFKRGIAEVMLKPYLFILNHRLKLFDSLPDLRWYVNDKSFESSKTLIINFLDETIGRNFSPYRVEKEDSGKTVLQKISNLPRLNQEVKRTMTYEIDFIEYSARANIMDVNNVLSELYENQLFNF